MNFLWAQAPNINYPVSSPQVLHVNTPVSWTPGNSGGIVPATVYGTVTTVAGTGTLGYADGANATAQFNIPEAVTEDAAGNLYVADYNNNSIRKITPGPGGQVTTIAGSTAGTPGFVNGIGTAALFNGPDGIAIDPSGNYLYVSDYTNNVIRKIALADGTVSTFVTGIESAYGLCFDAAGNLLVAGYNSYKILKITPAGTVTTVAGSSYGYNNSTSPTSAEFELPEDVQTDAAGNIYVADYWNNAIRKISPSGVVTTFAGSDVEGNTPGWADGTGTAAQFFHPTGVALGNGNVIYVADLENNDIRRIFPDGTVSTVAGNQTAGTVDGVGTSATFYHPCDLYIDNTGVGYIADARNGSIRKIVLTGYTIDKPLPAGLSFDVTTGKITGTPTSLSLLQSYTITAYNGAGFSRTTINIAVEPPAAPTAAPPLFTYNPSATPYILGQNIDLKIIPGSTGGPVPATEFGQVTTIAGSGTQFNSLWGIDIRTDVNGTQSLIVSDVNQLWKMNINGTGVSTLTGSTGMGLAAGLSVLLTGDVFVGDVANKSFRQISTAGVATNNPGSGIVNFDPEGVATDLSGDVLIADRQDDVIREFKTDGTSGIYAGNGNAGGSNGPAASATFNEPTDIEFDQSGNLFVADQGGNVIRKISNGTVSTVAGSSQAGLQDGPIGTAMFNKPIALAVDVPGGVYVSDQGGRVIRMIDQCGMVVPVAGDILRQISADGIGGEAAFTKVSGLAYSNGALYAADKTSVRKIVVTGYVIDKPLPTGMIFSSSTGEISGIPTAAGNYSFTVTGFNTGGCYSYPVTFTVIENPPNISYPPSPPSDFIDTVGVSATIKPTNTGGAATSYTIDPSDLPLPPGLTLDPTTGIISGTPTGVYPKTPYTITAQNSGGSSIAHISITVVQRAEVITFNPIPVKTYGDPDFDPGATSNDSGAPITYATDDSTVATIINGLVHITGTGTVNITASQAGDATYSVATSVKQVLTVNKAPLTIKADDQSRQTGEANPVLTATYTGFVYGESVAQLTTLPVLNTSATITSPAGTYPITISGATATNYIITEQPGTLTVTPAHPAVTIPNAFTPNGDGFNDLWNIKSIESYPKCIVSIYNRYGNLIYQSRGYARSWDGTYNGSPVPTGTYYYIIDLGDNSNKLSGYVAVIR